MTDATTTLQTLYRLRGAHDQTARTEAIKAIVEYVYGPGSDKDVTVTQAFIELMIDKIENGKF